MWALSLVTLAPATLAVITPFDLAGQIAFGSAVTVAVLLLNRLRGRRMTLALALISAIVSTRYLYWRVSETLEFDNPVGAFLGIGLPAMRRCAASRRP